MKNLTFTFALILAGFGVSCQSDTLSIKTDVLDQIAADPVYDEYQLIVYENLNHILMNEFDLEAIGEVIRDYPHIGNICDLPELVMAKVRGGLLYKDLQCRLNKAVQNYKAKYPEYVGQMNEAEIGYLMKKWNELNGYEEQMINQQNFKMRIDGNN